MEDKKKNILVIVSKLANGGAERAAINIAEKLSEKYNVKILVFMKNVRDYDTFLNVLEISNLKNKNYTRFFGIYELWKLKKKEKIDVTISFLLKPNLFNVITKRKDKVITTVRNNMNLSNTEKEKRIHKKIIAKYTDTMVCVSKWTMEDQIINYGLNPKKAEYVYNFCDKEKIEKMANQKIMNQNIEKFLNSENTVINVGRLHRQKGQHHLIKAFKLVVEKIPDAKLAILGRGEQKEVLQNLVIRLNLQKNIMILDFDSNPYKYMKYAKIFVLSSYYEGLPNVVLEAMSLGKAIISTDCNSGPREIICQDIGRKHVVKGIEKKEYGILVPAFNEDDYSNNFTKEEKYLAKAICDLLKNKSELEFYKKKSLERIKDFSSEKIIKKWEEIIEK